MISYDQYLQFSPYFAQEDIEKEESRLKFFKTFDTLSQSLKNLITSVDTTEKIINMGKTFELDEFDTEGLAFVIRKIAAGEIFIGDGIEFMTNETGLPNERAKTLLSLVVNEILAPALEDVKKIQTAKFPQRVGAVPASNQRVPIKPNFAPAQRPEISQISNLNVIDLRNKPK